MDIKEFAAMVQLMRDAQKAYYKHQTADNLIKAKKLEFEVDAMTVEVLKGVKQINLAFN